MARLPLTPAFRRLWLADAVSMVGDSMCTTTMVLWIYEITEQRGLWVSAFVIAGYLPSILVVPLFGGLADQWDRRRLMIALDLVRFGLGGALAVAVSVGEPVAALVLVASMSGAGAIFGAAQQAAIPASVEEVRLPRANAIMSLTTQLSFVVGPGVAAVLIGLVGPVPAVLFDAATFLGSAAVLFGLRLPSHDSPGPGESAGTIRPVLHAMRAWWPLPVVVFAAAMLAVSAGVNNTIMVLYLDQGLGGSPADIAWLSGANGIAQIIVGGTVVVIAGRLPIIRSLAVSITAMAVFAMVLATATNVPVAVAAVVVIAMANAPFTIAYTTLLQTVVPSGLTGRLFAVTSGITSAAFLFGSLGGGALADASTARTGIAASTACLVIGALLTAPLWRFRVPDSAVESENSTRPVR